MSLHIWDGGCLGVQSSWGDMLLSQRAVVISFLYAVRPAMKVDGTGSVVGVRASRFKASKLAAYVIAVYITFQSATNATLAATNAALVGVRNFSMVDGGVASMVELSAYSCTNFHGSAVNDSTIGALESSLLSGFSSLYAVVVNFRFSDNITFSLRNSSLLGLSGVTMNASGGALALSVAMEYTKGGVVLTTGASVIGVTGNSTWHTNAFNGLLLACDGCVNVSLRLESGSTLGATLGSAIDSPAAATIAIGLASSMSVTVVVSQAVVGAAEWSALRGYGAIIIMCKFATSLQVNVTGDSVVGSAVSSTVNGTGGYGIFFDCRDARMGLLVAVGDGSVIGAASGSVVSGDDRAIAIDVSSAERPTISVSNRSTIGSCGHRSRAVLLQPGNSGTYVDAQCSAVVLSLTRTIDAVVSLSEGSGIGARHGATISMGALAESSQRWCNRSNGVMIRVAASTRTVVNIRDNSFLGALNMGSSVVDVAVFPRMLSFLVVLNASWSLGTVVNITNSFLGVRLPANWTHGAQVVHPTVAWVVVDMRGGVGDIILVDRGGLIGMGIVADNATPPSFGSLVSMLFCGAIGPTLELRSASVVGVIGSGGVMVQVGTSGVLLDVSDSLRCTLLLLNKSFLGIRGIDVVLIRNVGANPTNTSFAAVMVRAQNSNDAVMIVSFSATIGLQGASASNAVFFDARGSTTLSVNISEPGSSLLSLVNVSHAGGLQLLASDSTNWLVVIQDGGSLVFIADTSLGNVNDMSTYSILLDVNGARQARVFGSTLQQDNCSAIERCAMSLVWVLRSNVTGSLLIEGDSASDMIIDFGGSSLSSAVIFRFGQSAFSLTKAGVPFINVPPLGVDLADPISVVTVLESLQVQFYSPMILGNETFLLWPAINRNRQSGADPLAPAVLVSCNVLNHRTVRIYPSASLPLGVSLRRQDVGCTETLSDALTSTATATRHMEQSLSTGTMSASDSLAVQLPQPVDPLTIAATTTVGIATAVASVSAPTGSLATRRLSLLAGLGACLVTDGSLPTVSDVLTDDVDVMNSPTRISFGPLHGAMHRGAVVGNVIVWLSFAVFGLLCTLGARRLDARRQMAATDADRHKGTIVASAAKLRVPGLFFIVVALLLQQVVVSSVLILLYPPPPSEDNAGSSSETNWAAVDGVLGAVGLLLVAAVTVAMLRVLDPRPSRFRAVAEPNSRVVNASPKPSAHFAGRFLSVVQLLRSDAVQWRSRNKHDDALFVERYGFLFEGCKGHRHWWVMLEMGVTLALGIMSAIVPSSVDACEAEVWIALVICIAVCGVTMWLRPMNNLLENSIVVLLSMTQLGVAAVTAFGESRDISDGMSIAGAVLSSLLVLVSLAFVVNERWKSYASESSHHRREREARVIKLVAPRQKTHASRGPQHNAEMLTHRGNDALKELIQLICDNAPIETDQSPRRRRLVVRYIRPSTNRRFTPTTTLDPALVNQLLELGLVSPDNGVNVANTAHDVHHRPATWN